MTHIATYIEVRPDAIRQGVALIEQYRNASRAEPGCSGIDALQEIHRPNRWVILEDWDSDVTFEGHEGGEQTLQFRQALRQIHKSPLDQRVHQAFAVAASRPSGEAGLMIVTHVDVPPPRRDETEALLQSAVEQARNQQGNTRFDIFQQKAPRTNHFTLVAGWSREDAFAQHEGDARTRQFREALAPMLGALYDERVYRALD